MTETPAGLTHQYLTRTPRSLPERVALRFARKAAAEKFSREQRVRSVPLPEAFPGIEQTPALIQGVLSQMGFGNTMVAELVCLAQVCAHLKPQTVFEFGTYDGLATLHFAMNSPETARITTIDLAPDDPLRATETDDTFYTKDVVVGAHFHGQPAERKIEQIFHNSMTFDESRFAGSMDLIFIDGGHDYDVAASDTEKALRMVKPGGVILWHDYEFTHWGVYTMLNKLAPKYPIRWIAGTSIAFLKAEPGLNGSEPEIAG